MRVLVTEHRPEAHKLEAIVIRPNIRLGPDLPNALRRRMCGRAEGENVQYHGFIIAIPYMLAKTSLGMPRSLHAVGIRLKPVPIGAPVQRIGEGANLLLRFILALEIGLYE